MSKPKAAAGAGAGQGAISFIFSIAPILTAMRRSPDGGARLTIDVDESGVEALNQMMDIAVARKGAAFAAAVVVVEAGPEIKENPNHGRIATEAEDYPGAAQRPTQLARR